MAHRWHLYKSLAGAAMVTDEVVFDHEVIDRPNGTVMKRQVVTIRNRIWPQVMLQDYSTHAWVDITVLPFGD